MFQKSKAELRSELKTDLETAFGDRFGGDARLFRAPGRVNLIGEHTDYNDGYVMPAAISFDVGLACAKTNGEACELHELHVHSLQERETAVLSLLDDHPQPLRKWTDYVRGVEVQLRAAGYKVPAGNLLIDGRVPIGAGLSSSAALEVAVTLGLLDLCGATMDRIAIAKLCQRAENEFVGARCGIMDQFASVFGRAGNALLLDCRSLELRYVPLPEQVSLVICNTMVKHSISGGEYNQRRAECEQCVQFFASRRPEVTALRDVSEAELEQYRGGLPEVLFRRCRHVLSENARVLVAADALQAGNLTALGQLMYASHASLRDDYHVSCRELDIMVDLASKIPGTFGARMTGGGFGGCTINIVSQDAVEKFKSTIAMEYKKATAIEPEIYVTLPSDGAGLLR